MIYYIAELTCTTLAITVYIIRYNYFWNKSTDENIAQASVILSHTDT